MIHAHEVVIMANNFSEDCMFVVARRSYGSTIPPLTLTDVLNQN